MPLKPTSKIDTGGLEKGKNNLETGQRRALAHPSPTLVCFAVQAHKGRGKENGFCR